MMNKKWTGAATVAMVMSLVHVTHAEDPNQRVNAGLTPEREAHIQRQVETLMSTLTLKQKVAQLMGTADTPKLARGEAISGIWLERRGSCGT